MPLILESERETEREGGMHASLRTPTTRTDLDSNLFNESDGQFSTCSAFQPRVEIHHRERDEETYARNIR